MDALEILAVVATEFRCFGVSNHDANPIAAAMEKGGPQFALGVSAADVVDRVLDLSGVDDLLAACEACRTELAYLLEQNQCREGGSVFAAYQKTLSAICKAKGVL